MQEECILNITDDTNLPLFSQILLEILPICSDLPSSDWSTPISSSANCLVLFITDAVCEQDGDSEPCWLGTVCIMCLPVAWLLEI